MTALQQLETWTASAPHPGGAGGGRRRPPAARGPSWLAAQPVAPCFTPYRDVVALPAAYRDIGAAVAAVRGTAGGGDQPPGEVSASLDLVVDTMAAALPACGVTALAVS
jgi:hypothetical protein